MRRDGAIAFAIVAVGLLLSLLATAGCKESGPSAPPADKPPVGTRDALPAVPLGLPPVEVPKDNPMTAEKVELGRLLYFDKRLSKDGSISCATCHDPAKAWAEELATSKGVHEQIGDRNAPTVINTAYLAVQFWDGRAASLEEQALGPIENPVEMGQKMEVVTAELEKDPDYQKQFREVFGTAVTKESIAKAIAAFERTILSGDSPYDRHRAGDDQALSEEQERGLSVFLEKGMCSTCHLPPTFSNSTFYNAGVGMNKDKPDEGRRKVTGKGDDFGKFRVPALREVARTAPYFHDGSVKTLEDAVGIMAGGGLDNPHLSAIMKTVREVEFTDQDKADLVAFLKALSGTYPIIEPPK